MSLGKTGMVPRKRESIEQFRRDVQLLREFIYDVARWTGKIPHGLKRAVDRYTLVIELGLDIGEAAAEVEAEIQEYFKAGYDECKSETQMVLMITTPA